MAVEKPQENWTKFPNCILDNLSKIEPSELMVLCLMIRKNLGYDNPNKLFALEYIMKKCGIKSKGTAHKAVNGLIEKGLISRKLNGNRPAEYEINWSEPISTENRPVRKIDQHGTEIGPLPVQKSDSLKENNIIISAELKENNNQATPEPAQNITNDVKSIFDKGNINLTGKKLSWSGKEKEYGRNLQLIIKASENDFDEIRKRASKLYELVKTDDWYKKQGFTPSALLSAWNKLADIRRDAKSLDSNDKIFPDWQNMTDQEIQKTFNNPDFPFQTHEILPHLPEEIKTVWKSKGFYFYGLSELLINYKRSLHVSHN